MKRRDSEVRDVDECKEKIESIMKEYRCQITVDKAQDPPQAILFDLDNDQFDWIGFQE